RVPPLRRFHRRARRHLVRRRGGDGLDDHDPAHQPGRGALRRPGAARPPRGAPDGRVRELDEGDAALDEEAARSRPGASGADPTLRPARGLPARAGGSADAVSAPSPRAAWPRWPPGLEPATCPVFVANQHEVAAPPDVVWEWLFREPLVREVVY